MKVISDIVYELRSVFTRRSALKLIYFLLSSLIICAPALYNGFPLLFADTGSYIHSAFTLKPLSSRPIGYSLFLMIFSARMTLWTVMYVQCLIVNRLVWDVLKTTLHGRNIYPYHFTSIIVLMLISSMSWYSCQIMPDIFTSGIFLIMYLFLIEKRIGPLRGLILSLLLFAFIISHFSHIAITMALLVTVLILFFFRNSLFVAKRIFYRRMALMTFVLIASVLFIMSNHHYHGHGFKLSLTSNVFMAGRLAENGILHHYLEENCDRVDNVLCDQIETMPTSINDFLWTKNSPIRKAGFKNWFEADSAFAPLINDLFKIPKYRWWFVWESVKATSRQFFKVDIGSGIIGYRESSPVYPPLKKYLKYEAVEMLVTIQSWGKLNFDTINRVNYVVLGLSLIILFWALAKKFLTRELFTFVILTILGIFYNTAITASLSNIGHRKQARVTWLLVFIALIIIFEVFKKIKDEYLPVLKEQKKTNP